MYRVGGCVCVIRWFIMLNYWDVGGVWVYIGGW